MTTKGVLHAVAEVLRRSILILLMVAFALAATVTLLARALNSTLNNEAQWHKMIEEIRLAERSRMLIADFLVTYPLEASPEAAFLKDYPLSIWEGVAEVLLPIGWLEENMHSSLGQAFSWLKGQEQELPNFRLDLSPVRGSLQGERGALAILPLLQGIPICPEGTGSVSLMSGGLMSCLPRDKDLTGFAGMISQIVAQALPAEISLATLEAGDLVNDQTYRAAEKARLGLQALDQLVVFGLGLSLLLLCLYALLNSPSPARVAGSLPWPLYAAGGLSLLLLIGWQIFVDVGLGLAMTGLLSATALETQALLSDMLGFLSQGVVREWLPWIAALFGAAILLQLLVFAANRLIKRFRIRGTASEPIQSQPRLRKQFR
jgi:hypothetical protein